MGVKKNWWKLNIECTVMCDPLTPMVGTSGHVTSPCVGYAKSCNKGLIDLDASRCVKVSAFL